MADEILCRCGASFAPHAGKSNRFCSMACYRSAQRSGEYKRGHGPDFNRSPCLRCGVTVERRFGQCRDGRKSDKLFCSRSCYDEHRASVCMLRSATCSCCRKVFLQGASQLRSYCSHRCMYSARKATPKNCVNCKCLFTPIKLMATGKFISHNSGKTCSALCQNEWIRNNPERKRKISEAFRGDKHPQWEGGKSLLNNISSRGANWQKQREAARARDRYQCVDCGISEDDCRAKYGRALDVDHVVPFHNFSDYKKANRLTNLQSRCASCHRIAEAKRGMVQMVLSLQDGAKRSHRGKCFGERINTAKLTAPQVMEIRRSIKNGGSAVELATRMGVRKSTIYQIVRGDSWKHLPI